MLTYCCVCIVVGAVPGHKSSLAFGLIGPGEGVPVVVMLGRVSLAPSPVSSATVMTVVALSFIRMKVTNYLPWFILSA